MPHSVVTQNLRLVEVPTGSFIFGTWKLKGWFVERKAATKEHVNVLPSIRHLCVLPRLLMDLIFTCGLNAMVEIIFNFEPNCAI